MLEEQTFLIRELKNRLVTRSHVHSPEVEIWSSQKWKKVFIWYIVLIEVSQEGEASSPEMGKVYLSGKGNNLRFPRKWKWVPEKWKWYLTGRR